VGLTDPEERLHMISTGPESEPPPLLTTKTLVPMTPAGFIHRPRLVELINRGARGPLTVLSAPAGLGKTTALAEWARQTDCTVAWLTLGSEDDNPWRFGRYFGHAIQTASPGLGEESLEYLPSSIRSNSELALTLLINQIAAVPEHLAVVLNEYQFITDPLIHRGLNYLITHGPPNLHLLIATRSEPELDVAFLRAKSLVTEIGTEHLRFTEEEAAQFLHQTTGVPLPPETVRTLTEQTEGWATALQLAALAARHGSGAIGLTGAAWEPRYLVDFLVQEVLNRQPEEVRRFLLRTCHLEALCGPLCEAVAAPEAEAGYGARMLRRLHHQNLFLTPLDQQSTWYRYHRLFAECLQRVQEDTDAAEIPELHRRAAAWLETNGRLDAAFQHALATTDGEWAADLFDRHAVAMIRAGELQTLTLWLGRLPAEVVRQRPILSMAFAYSLIEAHQFEAAQLWLEDAARLLDGSRSPAEDRPSIAPMEAAEHRRLRGILAFCRSTLAIRTGDAQRAAEFSRAAQEDLPEDDPFSLSLLALDRGTQSILQGDTAQAIESLREAARMARLGGNLGAQVVLTCQLAEMQALQGQLGRALATLEKARSLTLRPDRSPLPLAGFVDCMSGAILRERDRLKEARQVLERGLELSQTWWSLSSLDCLLSLARVLQSQGDVSGAMLRIDEAARRALSSESSPWDEALVAGTAVRLALQRNDVATATAWRRQSRWLDSPDTLQREAVPYHIFENLLLTQARFQYTSGRGSGNEDELRRVRELLQSIVPEVERFRRVTSEIEVLVLLALAEYELGENEQALRSLLGALALGEPEDYRRVFLDEGPVMAALLTRCRVRRPTPGSSLPSQRYIESLLEACQRETGAQPQTTPQAGPGYLGGTAIRRGLEPATARTPAGLPITLSAREVEVLALIAEGKSNQEISAHLFLALNTVKRHAYNIFAKLDVKNRTQAVARARQLGLIP
jgi:LuxR family maltose regulon positive regulatory protein